MDSGYASRADCNECNLLQSRAEGDADILTAVPTAKKEETFH
jgi:hypothetical protein